MKLTDGTGNSYAAKVDDGNRLHVVSLTKTSEHAANHDEGEAYSISFSSTPTGAGDCFFYIKNEDEKDMIIEGIGMYLPAAEYFDVVIGDSGTPVGGSDITPVNLNAGSGKTASGTFLSGNDITGLSGGSVVYRIYKVSGTGSEYNNFDQDIIIPKNATFSLYVQTGTTALAGFIDLYLHQSI
jgi:hypothetical protein